MYVFALHAFLVCILTRIQITGDGQLLNMLETKPRFWALRGWATSPAQAYPLPTKQQNPKQLCWSIPCSSQHLFLFYFWVLTNAFFTHHRDVRFIFHENTIFIGEAYYSIYKCIWEPPQHTNTQPIIKKNKEISSTKIFITNIKFKSSGKILHANV